MNKFHILWILVFIAFLIFSVFLFTGQFFSSGIDFSTTGSIGDTIGGITSPIIGIVGSYFIIVSFREQKDANDLQRISIEGARWYEMHYELLLNFKLSVEKLSLIIPKHPTRDLTDTIELRGIHAIIEVMAIKKVESLVPDVYSGSIGIFKLQLIITVNDMLFLIFNINNVDSNLDNYANSLKTYIISYKDAFLDGIFKSLIYGLNDSDLTEKYDVLLDKIDEWR